MNYVGKYDKHECNVELSNVEVSDSGNWTCKVEGYGFFTRGDIVEKHLSLKVMNYTQIKAMQHPYHFPLSSDSKQLLKLRQKHHQQQKQQKQPT